MSEGVMGLLYGIGWWLVLVCVIVYSMITCTLS